MKYSKTIVCFANSRKTSGRCIAGKVWRNGRPGEWVRPVSTRETREISEEERRYENGRDPQLLDIVFVTCVTGQPLPHQSENHVIDPKIYWVRQGSLAWSSISEWLDQPATLWGSGESSYSGTNNRVAKAPENGSSLYLVAAESIRLLVGKKAQEYPDSKRAVRGEFVHKGVTYLMDVTDPVLEREFLAQGDGSYDIAKPVLCISLGDPYQGYYYKLVAGVLYAERFK